MGLFAAFNSVQEQEKKHEGHDRKDNLKSALVALPVSILSYP
jgi:hypothetical protein